MPNGHSRTSSDTAKAAQVRSSLLFPEVDSLLSLFKISCMQLIDIRKQIDGELYDLKNWKKVLMACLIVLLEKGVDGWILVYLVLAKLLLRLEIICRIFCRGSYWTARHCLISFWECNSKQRISSGSC